MSTFKSQLKINTQIIFSLTVKYITFRIQSVHIEKLKKQSSPSIKQCRKVNQPKAAIPKTQILPAKFACEIHPQSSLGSNYIGAIFPAKFAGDVIGFCNGACTTTTSTSKLRKITKFCSLVYKFYNCGERKCATKRRKHWFQVNDIIKILSNAFPCTGVVTRTASLCSARL